MTWVWTLSYQQKGIESESGKLFHSKTLRLYLQSGKPAYGKLKFPEELGYLDYFKHINKEKITIV